MSRIVEQHFKVSMVPGGVPTRVYLKRYDTGIGALKFHLYGDNNEPYLITNDTTVSFKGSKIIPGGTSYMLMYNCSFTSNVVSLSVPLQLTIESGEVNCELRFVDSSGNSKGSTSIILEVEDSAPQYGVTISGTDIAYANQVLEQLQAEYAYKELINQSPFKFKGTVAAQANLPASGNTINDTYYVTGLKYAMSWNGSAWSQSSFNENDYIQRLTELESAVSEFDDKKIDKPINNSEGKRGQVLRANGDGTAIWATFGTPQDDQVVEAVNDWLDIHPEALKEYNYETSTKTFVM